MLLISSPAKAWEEILIEEDKQNVQMGFVYPSIGLCGLAVFLGNISLAYAQIQLQAAMTKTCSALIALFGGFFLASVLVDIYSNRILKQGRNLALSQQFVGYSMSVIFVLSFLSGIFPDFLILRWILQFYTIYVVWEGAQRLMKVREERLLSYTLVVSIIILVAPVVLRLLFDKLSQLSQLSSLPQP